jgi:predicted HicB family RNase H-like nuclease
MKLTASAKTAIDKAFRHFVSEKKSNRELSRADLTRYLTSCGTGKSVIWEIELLPLDYIAKHAFPSPEVLEDAARSPAGFVRTPQSRAILEANVKPLPEKERKPVNVASKPKVEPKRKQMAKVPEGKVGFMLRLKADDLQKLRLVAAEEGRSANMYVARLLAKHLAKFDFGVLSL